MKTVKILVMLYVVFVCSVGFGQRVGGALTSPISGGRSLTSPVSGGGYAPTIPGSTYHNSLIPNTRSLLEYNPNLVMEGNVGGGRQFRGDLPYFSRYETSLQSVSPVDSFIRRSSGVPYLYDRQPGRVQPYYLPQRSVSSVLGGSPLVASAPQLEYGVGANRSAESKALDSRLEGLGMYQPRSTLSMSVDELDRLSGRRALTEALSMQTGARGLEIDGDEAKYTRTMDMRKDGTARAIDKTLEPVKPFEPEVPISPQTQATRDLLDREQKIHDDIRQKSKQPHSVDVLDELENTLDQETDVTELERGTVDKAAIGRDVKAETGKEQQGKTNVGYALGDADSSMSMHGRAQAILGEHKTLEDLSEWKVKTFTEEGDRLLKKGQFYKAISQYVLASVWKNDSAEMNLHRAVAHFGAGEYMSSSLYLRRAIDFGADMSAANKDRWVRLLGDRELLETQMKELEELQDNSKSGEMAFLIGYVYYAEGNLSKAQEYIPKAQEKMAGDEAVAILKKAIAEGW